MTFTLSSSARPWLEPLVTDAVATLDRNVVTDDLGPYIRAGAGYQDPWTRDAALNSWGAAAFLRPDVARATLRRVCEDLPDGRRVIAQDAQWWDQVVWVIAAHDLAVTTGDAAFLREAYEVGTASVELLHRDRYRAAWGLYAGPGLMQDGISGLPSPPATTDEATSFVLDFPEAREVMTLSTNCLYVAAFRALAETAAALSEPADGFDDRADALAAAVRAHLTDGGVFGYFRHGGGPLAGTLDTHREAAGLAFAVLADVTPDARATLATVGIGDAGVVNVSPHFADRYSDARPGRHNSMCWPMVMGLVGLAHARAGDAGGVDRTIEQIRDLVAASDGRFDELYDPATGRSVGGWQCGEEWPSEPDQTWSATSLLRLVHLGVLGVRVRPDGLRFEPVRPAGGDVVAATGFPYRRATLDVTVGAGARTAVRVDGVDVSDAAVHLPGSSTGRHIVDVEVGPPGGAAR